MPLEQIALTIGLLLAGVVVATTIGSLVGRRIRISRERRAAARPASPATAATATPVSPAPRAPDVPGARPAAPAPTASPPAAGDRRRTGIVITAVAAMFVIGSVGGVGLGAVMDWLRASPSGEVAQATGSPDDSQPAGEATSEPSGSMTPGWTPDAGSPSLAPGTSPTAGATATPGAPGTPGATLQPGTTTRPGATPTPGATPRPTGTPAATATATPTSAPTPSPDPTPPPTPDPTPTPTPDPTPTPTPVPSDVDFSWSTDGLTVTFSNETGGPGTWAWDFGDGGSSTKRNPTHTYAAAGSYEVTLSATRSGETTTRRHTVTVSAP